ncbi:uncharacterized protein OCT59_015088 [Rhizophagus irregularis]|uniref:uncharacterized protein n=1 Tax=Rhizophagus irregularis TaxID=588596 RepID=UPI003320B09B|nr:hypothetical protein OCT59_015088 [Rhizophagus irregularis]
MALDSCFEGLDAEDQFQTLNFAKVSVGWILGGLISVERIFKWIGLQLSECFLNRTSKIRDFLELQDIFKYFNFNKVLLTNKIFSFIVDLQLLGWDLDRTSKVFGLFDEILKFFKLLGRKNFEDFSFHLKELQRSWDFISNTLKVIISKFVINISNFLFC